MCGQHRTAGLTGVGGGAGARVVGCWGSQLRCGVPPGDEESRTVSCERRRLPRNALIKLEVGLGLLEEVPVRRRLGRLVPAGRSAGGGDRRWLGGLADMAKDALHWDGLGDEGDDAHVRPAAGTDQGQGLEQPGQQHHPEIARRGSSIRRRGGRGCGELGRCARVVGQVTPQDDGRRPQGRVGREHAMVAMAMPPGRRDQRREMVDQLQWGERQRRGAIALGLR